MSDDRAIAHVLDAGRGLATALEEVVAHPEAPREQLEHVRDEALARWIVAVVDARGEVER